VQRERLTTVQELPTCMINAVRVARV